MTSSIRVDWACKASITLKGVKLSLASVLGVIDPQTIFRSHSQSNNPKFSKRRGALHLFRTSPCSSIPTQTSPSTLLFILSVPNYLSFHDFIPFCGPTSTTFTTFSSSGMTGWKIAIAGVPYFVFAIRGVFGVCKSCWDSSSRILKKIQSMGLEEEATKYGLRLDFTFRVLQVVKFEISLQVCCEI
ncbi:uncharacterized protein HKW66_Vig0122270 [Vigna angularis]|uniref:BRCA1-associated 2/ETP1 RRM domain-containing protein n=1 Tax=Phaseolus angularis TaxID=3914 RepID=A0A8T0JXD7_PHAAN|nr:uncharacterized protein HKW66_Vig0122270 [Vigna angularis]